MTKNQAVTAVESYLQQCVRRGFFSGFNRSVAHNRQTRFSFCWHNNYRFEVVVDFYHQVIRVPVVLPGVEKRSNIASNFRAFVKQRHSDDMPAHRRIDKTRLEVKPMVRNGNMSLSVMVRDGDYAYGVDKLVCLIHEVFTFFLKDGLYYQYLVDNFGLNPDSDF